MIAHPENVFDRTLEWDALARFAGNPEAGATLGLVYGRRRQGKTLLLESLCQASGGLLIAGLEQSSAQNLAAVGASYARYRGLDVPVAFPSWTVALRELLALGEHSAGPVPVVLDEFPYLMAGAPELPSIIQAALSPRGRARTRSAARLILCGSAFSVMGSLLGGTAPLRGRAAMELLVHPFDFRSAAHFWDLTDRWDVAVRLHALVGGTPAYRDYASGRRPATLGALGRWVSDQLFNPAGAFFREGRVLLAEELGGADPALYLSVLAAIAAGATRRGQIATVLGRKETALAHPLRNLEETRLIAKVTNPLHQRRSTYRLVEPMIRTHQLLIAPNEARLARHLGTAVWAETATTVESRIYGPHLEDLAREWALVHACPETLGGQVGQIVGAADVPCRVHRGHEVDVVVRSGDRVLALGEAKWRSLTAGDVDRLRHIRDVTPAAAGARLLLFTAGSGSLPGLPGSDVEIVDLERLYTGS